MESIMEETVLRKSVRVAASVERAFSVFVEQMETWWPASHHIGKDPFETIFVEPRVGGRWYERNTAGEQCDWGTVLAWDPPYRVRFSWHVGPQGDGKVWGYDPDMGRASEVEIRFIAEGAGTLVELEHSKLERHGENAHELRMLFDSPGAWTQILAEFEKKFNDHQETNR